MLLDFMYIITNGTTIISDKSPLTPNATILRIVIIIINIIIMKYIFPQ